MLGAARNQTAQAGQASSCFAGFWRALARQDESCRAYVEQKAHAEMAPPPGYDAKWRAWLNDQANKAAKLGAKMLRNICGRALVELGDRHHRIKLFQKGAPGF